MKMRLSQLKYTREIDSSTALISMLNKTFSVCQFPHHFQTISKKKTATYAFEAASQREKPSCIWHAGQGARTHAQTLKLRTGAVHTREGSLALCYGAYLPQTLSGTRCRSHLELSADQCCRRCSTKEWLANNHTGKPDAHEPCKKKKWSIQSHGVSSLGRCLHLHPSETMDSGRASENWNVPRVGGKVKGIEHDFCEVARRWGGGGGGRRGRLI